MGNNIGDGEGFRNLFTKRANKKGLILHDGIVNIYRNPKLKEISKFNNELIYLLQDNKSKYEISMPHTGKYDIHREGLSVMYGYGNIYHNYDIKFFTNINNTRLKYFKRLALEIWDRNIHLDWMRSKGYLLHNGTKDLRFCKYLASDDRNIRLKGILRHNIQSAKNEKNDSSHHAIKPKDFFDYLNYEQCPDILIEMFYDQASVAGRWYRKAKTYKSQKHSDSQNEIKTKGVVLHEKREIIHWSNPYREVDRTKFECLLWDIWEDINNKFSTYWNNRFGNDNKDWRPPVDPQELASLI